MLSQTQQIVIDWSECLELNNNNARQAKRLLRLLGRELDTAKVQIHSCLMDQNWPILKGVIHRMHGACCYSGIPRLRLAAAALEEQLETGDNHDTRVLIHKVMQEIDLVLHSLKEDDYHT